MAELRIEGKEHPIADIFSDAFAFTIPDYQRPYSWGIEQARELMEDFLDYIKGSQGAAEANPYFLGSIVLAKPKEDMPDAAVVDGQQRLATLTILLAALRASLVKSGGTLAKEVADGITKRIEETADALLRRPSRKRLSLRGRDEEFFRDYIQNEGGIERLTEASLNPDALSDSQRKIRSNALLFLSSDSGENTKKARKEQEGFQGLDHLDEAAKIELARFISMRCYLVVVSTSDVNSAYRIFSILNDRGLPLYPSDILKAKIIGAIKDKTAETKYTKKWEDAEAELGNSVFADLFSHIRMIGMKAKAKKSMLEEIEGVFNPENDPQSFIDKTLIPYANAFAAIKKEKYQSADKADAINKLFGWLDDIDNSDWLPPAILFLSKYGSDPGKLLRFFIDLERLAAGLMILRTNINKRIERYASVIKEIEDSSDVYLPSSTLQLTVKEQEEIVQALNGDIYEETAFRHYVLLRLDTFLSKGDAIYNYKTITIEHVLPQSPDANSEWVKLFGNDKKRARYVHKLGNLLLLPKDTNSRAQNYEFQSKKDKYFSSPSGVSPFALTTQVIKENQWVPAVVDRRQAELIGELKKMWRLEG